MSTARTLRTFGIANYSENGNVYTAAEAFFKLYIRMHARQVCTRFCGKAALFEGFFVFGKEQLGEKIV